MGGADKGDRARRGPSHKLWRGEVVLRISGWDGDGVQ